MLESVIATTPLWHNQLPYYVRPEIKPMVWDVIAEALIEPAAPTYDRIFVSRTPDRISRQCRNGADVEALFATHGFTVIYPEMLDLTQQAAIFAKARVIAGFGGSALFNTLFARNLETLIVLNHEAYTSRAEHLFTSFIDCEVHYFWSLPDAPRPESGWDRGQFFSPWEFDFARNGATLQKLLVSL
jgi:capsular polysaccharide biosynthesis protein